MQLAFADNEGPNFMSAGGTGTVIDDEKLKRQFWHKALEQWFGNGPEDPGVSLIKVKAHKILTWGRMGDCELE